MNDAAEGFFTTFNSFMWLFRIRNFLVLFFLGVNFNDTIFRVARSDENEMEKFSWPVFGLLPKFRLQIPYKPMETSCVGLVPCHNFIVCTG